VSATLTVHEFEQSNHRPGTVGHDEGRCAWGGRCQRPAEFSVLSEDANGRSWWACCAEHAAGLERIADTTVVWEASRPTGK